MLRGKAAIIAGSTKVVFRPGDVSRPEQVTEMIAQCVERAGAVGTL